ncbi:hypothetical protein [Streptomyces marianii]|uniref:Uncharacterized protein n=1 Tax=Streptomyces marianii TaxID=1817406 RepID=A0A5R9E0L6_9ACTN|nr:hypothetical protein [Streptomyces marianii]TLQ43226.1 hypothetical protein FEF34_08830 [Streptomyces marianii]
MDSALRGEGRGRLRFAAGGYPSDKASTEQAISRAPSFVCHAARQAGVPEAYAPDRPILAAQADGPDPAVTRLGIALVIPGFGAKGGGPSSRAWWLAPPSASRPAR